MKLSTTTYISELNGQKLCAERAAYTVEGKDIDESLEDLEANTSALIAGSNVNITSSASGITVSVPDGSTSTKGALQLSGSIGATVSTENGKAASEKAVRDALNALPTSNFSGVTFYSGDSSNAEHDANQMNYNGVYYGTSNMPSTIGHGTNVDGAVFVSTYNTSWVAQIAQDYRRGDLYVRGKTGVGEPADNRGHAATTAGWKAWHKVLDSSNSSVSKSGDTITVKINDASQSIDTSAFAPASHTHYYAASATVGGVAGSANILNIGGNWTKSDSVPPSGVRVDMVYNNGWPTTYGNVMTFGGQGTSQIVFGWGGKTGEGANIYYRNRRDSGGTTWSNWNTLAYLEVVPKILGCLKLVSSSATAPSTISGSAKIGDIYYLINNGTSNCSVTYNSYGGNKTVSIPANRAGILVAEFVDGTSVRWAYCGS